MNQLLSSFALLPVENILNVIINRDPHIRDQLNNFDNKCIEIFSTKPNFSLLIRFEDSAIKLSAIDSETLGLIPAATISAKSDDLVGLLLKSSNSRALADPAITISGDASLVQDLYQLTESLDIDWQDYLAPLLGDIISNELGKLVGSTKAWSRDASSRAKRTLSDYLNEEAKLVPSRLEVDSFSDRLDQLRLKIDRGSAKTEYLQRRLDLLSETQ